MATLMFAYNAEAQKAGILQIDHYGIFTGAQWESFLNRENAAEFEKYSNVKLFEYLDKFVTPYVKTELKETSIASAMDNSTKEQFPAGAEVQTMNAAGEWKKRTVRPGESGFFHHPTGTYWLSFSCGNLMFFGPGPLPKNKGTEKVDPALMVKYNPPGSGSTNNNTINVNPPGNNNGSELTWNVGYGVYSMGRNDRQNDFIVDASLYKMIQDAKQCCGGGATAPVQQISYATPSMVMQAAPASQQPNYSQNNQVNGRLAVDVTQRARAVDWAAATGQVMQGVGAIKMAFFPEPVDVKIRGGNASAVYGTSWTPTVYGTGFQGSNQLNALIPNTTTSNSPYGNTWGNAGTGLGLMPIGN